MRAETTSPELQFVDVDQEAWRVGFEPDPWAWPGWQWAGADGRFHGRWDDSNGNFRTIYAGGTLRACLLEVLACFRPDSAVAAELAAIDGSNDAHPTNKAGGLPYDWLEFRRAAHSNLVGRFCAVTVTESVVALRPHFVSLTHRLRLHDFDAAALRDGGARELTQAVATHLHATTTAAGVAFVSRHGDDLPMWAIFERAGDGTVSPCLTGTSSRRMDPDEESLREAMDLLGLHWIAD